MSVMSVIAFPRRIDTRRERPVTRRPTHRAAAPRSRAARSIWRGSTVLGKSTVIVVIALALSLAGSMVVANRQVEIHQLQSQLLQDQSTYAEQVGTMSNVSTPSQIASKASALHLVDPVSVIQVPSTSLDAPLPLPKFTGYAPVTSRTLR
jgi:uncharacterized protein HemX